MGYNGRDGSSQPFAETVRRRNQVISMGGFICKLCFERDGIATDAVVERRCTNERTGKQFAAFVCKHCLDWGRETRVTCRTFVPPVFAAKPRPITSS
jgi:hypothetical protein